MTRHFSGHLLTNWLVEHFLNFGKVSEEQLDQVFVWSDHTEDLQFHQILFEIPLLLSFRLDLTDEFFEFQPVIGILPGDLRVFLSIFDQTLTAHFLKTDDARTNRFLLLKQLTPKVHGDSMSDDTAPSSGSSELIKFKLQTLSTFATVVRF